MQQTLNINSKTKFVPGQYKKLTSPICEKYSKFAISNKFQTSGFLLGIPSVFINKILFLLCRFENGSLLIWYRASFIHGFSRSQNPTEELMDLSKLIWQFQDGICSGLETFNEWDFPHRCTEAIFYNTEGKFRHNFIVNY